MSAHQMFLEQPRDVMDEAYDSLEAKEAAIRNRIEGSADERGEAVADYFAASGIVCKCDGPDLLTEWTLALADASELLKAIAHGDPLPDSELQAFRALCRQSEEAKFRLKDAIDERVDSEVSQ